MSAHAAITSGTTLNADAFPATGVFTNLQDAVDWSGTEYARDPDNVWDFSGLSGYQENNGFGKGVGNYAWAVRPGQIAAAPLLGTALLMALSFAAMAVSRRERRRFW